MKPEFKFMGARSGPHSKYNHMTVINYAGGMLTNNFKELEPVGPPFETYPPSYSNELKKLHSHISYAIVNGKSIIQKR